MPSPADVRYLPETADHDAVIAEIADEAFGPGRFARAAERVREMAAHDRALSFVAVLNGGVIGSVRLTPVAIGRRPALMLGPLAVRPAHKNKGVGKALMRLAAEGAMRAGETVIFLVGDLPYYGPLGYRRLPPGSVRMPGPVDPARLLALPLAEGALTGLSGRVAPRL
ncbi:GNAT family N-acetyltransferase [Consotaella aegiceratis]|uniref:GNAT family N-acetyltransferase n=1 Tax=Consotaella aegiceratis TaxID=3097961 RepID=UPI002F413145